MHIFTSFLDPLLTNQIKYDVTALIYTIPHAIKAIFMPLGLSLMHTNQWDKRMMAALAFLLSSIAFIMSGPSELLNIGDYDSLRIIGWVVLSISRFIFDLCAFQEIVRSVHLKWGLNLDNPILNERADLWHTVFCSLG